MKRLLLVVCVLLLLPLRLWAADAMALAAFAPPAASESHGPCQPQALAAAAKADVDGGAQADYGAAGRRTGVEQILFT